MSNTAANIALAVAGLTMEDMNHRIAKLIKERDEALAKVAELSQPAQASTHPMCERKTNHIIERDGYAKTGYVLKKDGARICVSDGGAVAWFDLDQWQWLMHNRDHVEFAWPKPIGAKPVAAHELDVEAERREFEAWARDNRYDLAACGENSRIGPADAYRNTASAHAWDVWRAARSAAQATQPESAPVRTEQAGDAWISVEDRLPEIGTWCNVLVDRELGDFFERLDKPRFDVYGAQLRDVDTEGFASWQRWKMADGGPMGSLKFVTHWMPLPNPPAPNNSPSTEKGGSVK